MISNSIIIMVVGMAVVFSFLILLVVLMSILSTVVQRFFPEKEIELTTQTSASAEIAAVIAIAHSQSC